MANAVRKVAAHLKEDIVGEPEVKNLVRDLWRTHRRALQLAPPSVAGHNVGRRTPRLIVRATLGPEGGERWRFETVS